jgi:hypothetical protein
MPARHVNTRESVLRAMAEFDSVGRDAFLSRYGFGRAKKYMVRGPTGNLYDSKAIYGVAASNEYPELGALQSAEFSGGEHTVSRRLSRLGFEMVLLGDIGKESSSNSAQVAEQNRRAHLWAIIQASNCITTAQQARALGIYGGAQGTWVDKTRTASLTSDGNGVTVGLLHTGMHYADDLSDDGLIYHYPRTRRPESRDAGEIAATKNAYQLGFPVFVISRELQNPNLRRIRLGWIEAWDDSNRLFLVTFGEAAPNTQLLDSEESPFSLTNPAGGRRRTAERATRPGQQRFKFQAIQRYGAMCAVCKVSVIELLDAAHLFPKGAGGSDDPRNGLILCATHHRAFDAKHFAIDPRSLDICVRKEGPTISELHITHTKLSHLKKLPHSDALEWVWQRWNVAKEKVT